MKIGKVFFQSKIVCGQNMHLGSCVVHSCTHVVPLMVQNPAMHIEIDREHSSEIGR